MDIMDNIGMWIADACTYVRYEKWVSSYKTATREKCVLQK